VEIDHTTAVENAGNGLQATGTGAAVQISNSTFTLNTNGVSITSPGTVASFGNNFIAQNLTANVVGGTLLSRALQ
jgi:hypothetical protein